jgi:hypothetical protein
MPLVLARALRVSARPPSAAPRPHPASDAQAVFARPTRHLRLPMRDGLHPGSRSAVERGVDSDAPANAAVLPTMARPPPTVRPPLDALVLVLTFRSVPGAAGRSVQARRRLLVSRRHVASLPDSLPGDSLGTPKTGGPEACGEPRRAGDAQVPPALYLAMEAARSPFTQASNLAPPPRQRPHARTRTSASARPS